MAKCPKCGLVVPSSMKFCTGCGASMTERTLQTGPGCSKCGTENPVGSKFCAGCGSSLAPAQTASSEENHRSPGATCSTCGTVSPQGSKFCIRCGKTIGGSVQSLSGADNRIDRGTSGTSTAPMQPLNKDLQRVKMVLFAGVAINLIGAFQLYRLMSGIEQLWGVYADTSGLTFLLFVNLMIAAFLTYAAVQLGKGQVKFAKIGSAVLAVAGAFAILVGGMADGFSFILSLGCLVGGIWAWILIRHTERKASAIA